MNTVRGQPCGKPVKRNGKFVWLQPKYVKLFSHKLPDGRVLKVKGGTQVIDRCWRHIRSFLGSRAHKFGSMGMRNRIRSAQWAYWHQGEDLWLQTGEMLKRQTAAAA